MVFQFFSIGGLHTGSKEQSGLNIDFAGCFERSRGSNYCQVGPELASKYSRIRQILFFVISFCLDGLLEPKELILSGILCPSDLENRALAAARALMLI